MISLSEKIRSKILPRFQIPNIITKVLNWILLLLCLVAIGLMIASFLYVDDMNESLVISICTGIGFLDSVRYGRILNENIWPGSLPMQSSLKYNMKEEINIVKKLKIVYNNSDWLQSAQKELNSSNDFIYSNSKGKKLMNPSTKNSSLIDSKFIKEKLGP